MRKGQAYRSFGGHPPLLDVNKQPVPDVFDPALWERNGWRLADPSQSKTLPNLLSDIRDAQEGRRGALDHLRKVLVRAK